jgi:DNA-binding response OmpR family regulator
VEGEQPVVTSAGERLVVLLVEDDAGIAAQLMQGLRNQGYDVVHVGSGAEALRQAAADLVLLDLGLPDLDGVEVCRELRRRVDAPILVISARGEESDRVAALDLGADDYLVKPFGLAELGARMRAVLRRSQPGATVFRYGNLTVDASARRVLLHGEEVALTARELDVLLTLVAEPGSVVSREDIFSAVWDEHWYGPTKVLDVHVAALRRKLGQPALIETVHGRGFRLGPRP